MSRPVTIAGAAKLVLLAFGIAFMIAVLLPGGRGEPPLVRAVDLADGGSSGSVPSVDVSLRTSAPVPATAVLDDLRPRRSVPPAATPTPTPAVAATATPIPTATATPTAAASATPAPTSVPAPVPVAPARPVAPAPTPAAPVGGRFDGSGSGEFELSDGRP
jgi:hypothetical protein